MREETDQALRAMKELCKLIADGGLRDRERAEKDMDDMISRDYEPYFSGNAALCICWRPARDAVGAAGRRGALPSP